MNFSALLAFTAAGLCGLLAILALIRRRPSLVRWAFFGAMSVAATESACIGLAAHAISPWAIIAWQELRLLVTSALPAAWILFAAIYARPNLRQFFARWKLALAGAFAVPTGFAVLFRDRLVASVRAEPAADRYFLHLDTAGVVLFGLLLICSVLVLLSLERTFRESAGTTRWRIKFTLLGVGVLFVGRLYTSSQALLFRGIDGSWDAIDSGVLLVGALLMLRSFFRSGSFETKVYPSSFLIHHSLIIFLAGSYLLIVGVLAKIVTLLGGDAAFVFKTFVVLVLLALLAVIIQSDRLRIATKRLVSRHLRRPQYDYRTMWRSYTDATSSCVDPSDLCRTTVQLVTEMFDVLSVTIWTVRPDRNGIALAASTFFSENKGAERLPKSEDSRAAMQYFQDHPQPLDLDQSELAWVAALRNCHPKVFPNSGRRVCIPLVAHGEMAGLMILGDHIGRAAFGLQDLEALTCVAKHLAASVLNAQLSQKLLEAKQLCAVQTVATFFLHDLKNAASTLNLMLQNLPVHFHDIEFRNDTLRGISRASSHLAGLIGRLNLLRSEFIIKPQKSDLNQVVESALAAWEAAPGVVMVKDLHPLPLLSLDPNEIRKVVSNLVLNAIEAAPSQREVRVSTRLEKDWAVFTVADKGCGMSAEFIEQSLFRPLQTTKKGGLGIGMFQCRMIVEAHRGKIFVESAPSKGTSFEVLLPLTEAKPVTASETIPDPSITPASFHALPVATK